MPGRYMLVPKASHAVVEVATGTAVKTLLQLATPSTTDVRVKAWGVSFDGASPTAVAGVITLIDVDVAATVTAMTPEEWQSDDLVASLCVSGTAASGYNATAEGTIGGSRILDPQNVHPQAGYSIWLPEDSRPRVKASRFLRIRALFAVDVNCVPWIIFDEPA